MSDLISPEHLALLKSAVDVQEKMIDGCLLMFKGFSQSEDTFVATYSRDAIEAIEDSRAILEAMIDALNQTKH